MTFRRFAKAVDLADEIPSAEEAATRFSALGISFPRPGPRTLKDFWYRHVAIGRLSGWAYAMGLAMRGAPADYPLLAGYSDFLVIPSNAIERFVHYCGVFAALNLFAEVAVPTALALSCDVVRTELALNHHFTEVEAPRNPSTRWKGVEFWTESEMEAYADLFAGDLSDVLSGFPSDWLYCHPVKLSRYR